jgi:hypothetical protein
MTDTVLSIVMLGAVALVIVAYVMWRRGAPRINVILAIVLALVAIGNVLVMTIPYESGETPIEKAQELEQRP